MAKIKRNYIFYVIFILSWLVSGSAWAGGTLYSNVNQPIIVKPLAPTVIVRLPANPSTGYQWVLIYYDHTLMGTPTSRYISGRDLPGSPGYSVWQFRFKKNAFAVSQKTAVILEYKRPWEKLAGKKQVISINIQTK